MAPVITTLADKSDKLLHVVDSQVDAAVKTANNVIENQKQFHAQNLEQYKAARQAYLKRIEAVVMFVKDKGLSGTVQYLVDDVKERLAIVKAIPDTMFAAGKGAIESLVTSVSKLMEHPQVKGFVETLTPAAKMAWGQYMTVHDRVVALGLYRFSYDKATSLVSYAQGTGLFKFAQNRLYPYVQPYADPALETMMERGYYQALLNHVKPVA